MHWTGASGSGRRRGGGSRKYRTKAKLWLLAVDQLLRLAGSGLARFRDPKAVTDRPPHPSLRPTLSVALGQGSDGWRAVHYLGAALEMNIFRLPDPSHLVRGDAQLALRSAGFWPAVQLLAVVSNIGHGPWKDARWYQQARESVKVYLGVASPDLCPIW